jgi:ubiquinone/menaquinone biosynthesis C-methylase UbiE
MSATQNLGATTTSGADFFKRYGGSAPENYERYFVPAIGGPLAADLVDAAALRPGERVLDVACGTGVVARLAAARVAPTGTVAGVDPSPGMLAVARAVSPPDLAIVWHEARAEAMPMADESLDVVLCQLGLQFMADKITALREMRRTLAARGRIALNVPGPASRPFDIMDEALARHIGPEAAGFVRAVFSLHDPGEIRSLFAAAGFHDVEVQPRTKTLRFPSPTEFLWQYVQSTPLVAMVAQVDDERRTALERDVVDGLQGFVDDDRVTIPQRVVVVTARK